MKERILTGWNFQRILFLVMGTILIVQSGQDGEWMGIAVGSYFASMGIFRFGCAAGGCFGGNCNTETNYSEKTESREIEFEEIKEK
ncbi:hypothetical protein BH09BAC5_BH09BAC5_21950 [soil metagenome]